MTTRWSRSSAILSTRDKVVIGLLCFYIAVALSLELYWLVFNQVMETRTDVFAKILSLYWTADYTWRIPGYPPEKAFTLSLETVNVFVTPGLSLGLIWAILKRRPYRFALQLLIATYTFYGTFLYYSVAHISNYALFEDSGASPYLILYLANLPWLAGYAWLAWDAFNEIVQRAKS